jgi:hypothetical protein
METPAIDLTNEEIAQLHVELAGLRGELAKLQAENAQLQRMLMAGEMIGGCEYIGGDDTPCTKPASFLLVDESGLRCPVCEEHADADLEDVVKLRVQQTIIGGVGHA